MQSSAMLDGEYVDSKQIDPKKHRYVGMFRPPSDPCLSGGVAGYIICGCGLTLQNVGQSREHYLRGCFDVPQYQTIKEKVHE